MQENRIQIIPSISMIDNKITRLKKGDFELESVYKDSPIDLAQRFEDHGITQIQLVDLDGTRLGKPGHFHVLEAIAGHTNLEVDFAGGLTTDGAVCSAFDFGATRVTAATLAANRPEEFASWVMSYGREKIALGADTAPGNETDRKIAISGWQERTEIDLYDHIEFFYSRSLKYLKTSDISREGSVGGPSFKLYKELLDRFPGISLIASGGVRTIEDIEQLQHIGLYGVVFGKAFYDGMITLKDIEKFLLAKSA